MSIKRLTAYFILKSKTLTFSFFGLEKQIPNFLRTVYYALNWFGKPKLIIKNIVWSVLFQLSIVATFLVLDYLLLIGLNLFDYILLAGLTQIAMLIPISAGGVGLRDASLVGLLVLGGIEKELAVTASLITYPNKIVYVIIGYLLTLQYNHQNKKYQDK